MHLRDNVTQRNQVMLVIREPVHMHCSNLVTVYMLQVIIRFLHWTWTSFWKHFLLTTVVIKDTDGQSPASPRCKGNRLRIEENILLESVLLMILKRRISCSLQISFLSSICFVVNFPVWSLRLANLVTRNLCLPRDISIGKSGFIRFISLFQGKSEFYWRRNQFTGGSRR